MNRLTTAAFLVFLLACSATKLSTVPQSPEALQEGHQALKERRWDDAIAAFRRALADEAQAPTAMRALVEAHFRAGRLDPLIEELERSPDASPTDALAHYGLGVALYAQTAGAEARALEPLSRAAELAPKTAEYHFRVGVVHLESERFDAAIASLTRARELAPEEARHHVPLALALSRTGDRRGAIESIREMLELSPTPHDLEVAHSVMARVNDPFREFPKAVEPEFQRGLDFLEKADSPQQAIVVFEEILDRFPDLAAVHSALGLAYHRLDDAGRALDEYRRALELQPDDPQIHLYVADLYFSKEKVDKAVESYREVVLRDPLSEPA